MEKVGKLGVKGEALLEQRKRDSVGYALERREFTALGLRRKVTTVNSYEARTLCEALF